VLAVPPTLIFALPQTARLTDVPAPETMRLPLFKETAEATISSEEEDAVTETAGPERITLPTPSQSESAVRRSGVTDELQLRPEARTMDARAETASGVAKSEAVAPRKRTSDCGFAEAVIWTDAGA
jgi:hypothetical protein